MVSPCSKYTVVFQIDNKYFPFFALQITEESQEGKYEIKCVVSVKINSTYQLK